MCNKLMTCTLAVILFSISGAFAFDWSEDFEGTPSPHWVTSSGNGGSVGIVDDGTGNNVMKVDTVSGGYGIGGVWMEAFEGLDDSQEIWVSFDFQLQAPGTDCFVIASDFTGVVHGTDYWSSDVSGKLFDVPLNQWVSLGYTFTPDGAPTHKIWLNDSYIGEYASWIWPGYPDENMAFFFGDPVDGAGMSASMLWDNFSVTGTDVVPEPGSILALASGLMGFVGWFRRIRA